MPTFMQGGAVDKMGEHSRTNPTNTRVITTVQVVLVVCALVAFGWLIAKLVGYSLAQSAYRTMQSAYGREAGIDFASLTSDCPGAVAWIRMDDLSTIDYPIMQTSDNDYYLHNDANGQSSVDGSIFLDYRNKSASSDLHTIIYGHNMRDGSMFGTLISYQDEDFYKAGSGKFTIYTPSGTYRYQIFAVNIVDPSDDTFMVGFKDTTVFGAFAQRLKADSLYDTGVNVTGTDQIVTLSTCSSTDRLVVSAKRVNE